MINMNNDILQQDKLTRAVLPRQITVDEVNKISRNLAHSEVIAKRGKAMIVWSQ